MTCLLIFTPHFVMFNFLLFQNHAINGTFLSSCGPTRYFLSHFPLFSPKLMLNSLNDLFLNILRWLSWRILKHRDNDHPSMLSLSCLLISWKWVVCVVLQPSMIPFATESESFSSKSHPKLQQGFNASKQRSRYDAARRRSAFPAN